MNFEDRQMVKMLAENIEEQFKCKTMTASQFAEYLGRTRQYVCEKIRDRLLPGFWDGKSSYSIPVNAIAIWEVRLSKTENKNKNKKAI